MGESIYRFTKGPEDDLLIGFYNVIHRSRESEPEIEVVVWYRSFTDGWVNFI